MRGVLLALALLAAPAAAGGPPPFPLQVEVAFDLVDQDGHRRTPADFAGRPMAVFFGYANCDSICDVALPRMGQALEMLGPDAAGIAPVLITIDPKRDTPAALKAALPQWHPRMIGLTGSEAALEAARRGFRVETEVVYTDPEGNPVWAHGGFVYLIGADGELKALLPPILGPERMAELMRKHLLGQGA